MRVIPVLDLMAGQAVHASGGERRAYRALESVLVPPARASDPCELAHAFRTTLGCDECYVADLDAIAGGEPQRALLGTLARIGSRVFVDAGVATGARARELVALGAARVVVGLETLPSFAALEAVIRAVGPEQVVFSLDLRRGAPVLNRGASHHATPLALAGAAVASGVGAILVLDLARVGSGRGLDHSLLAAIRRAHAGTELFGGGGIASREELERLADLGLDGALVATALHAGGVGRADIDAVRRRGGPRRGSHASDSR